MKAVARTVGLKIPRRVFFLSSLSSTLFWPTRSDLIRAMAKSFSAWDSQRAVCGRSVRVKKAMMEMMQVTMPSIAKIIRHLFSEPNDSRLRMAEASKPPKAPARGEATM